MIKKIRHLFCFNYFWHVIDPAVSLWRIQCTKCGYIKDMK